MSYLSAPYRDGPSVRALAEDIACLDPGRSVRLMHVCGTHENALCRHALRDLLPAWLRLVAGPGCPVCVCPPGDIDLAVRLATEARVVLATFGDVVRVPARSSLADARASGADVRLVYGVSDAVELARQVPGREVVFFAVGFETTACTVAAALRDDPPGNFSVLVSHRLVPPALDALLDRPDVTLDGFLLPGHVTTVTGLGPYRELCARRPMPMVTGGFEPVDVMLALRELTSLAVRGEAKVVNAYGRAVREDGNLEALAAMDQVFQTRDAPWRGIGTIPGSGLGLRPHLRHLDAGERFGLAVDHDVPDTVPGCRCGDVLLGLVEPQECSLFGAGCTPDEPVGPCMVGFEGTCNARFRHARGTA